MRGIAQKKKGEVPRGSTLRSPENITNRYMKKGHPIRKSTGVRALTTQRREGKK